MEVIIIPILIPLYKLVSAINSPNTKAKNDIKMGRLMLFTFYLIKSKFLINGCSKEISSLYLIEVSPLTLI